MSQPSHHEKPMYRDEHDGQDMRRWLCAEPGCPCAISDETLAVIADADWANEYGMVHPNEIVAGGALMVLPEGSPS